MAKSRKRRRKRRPGPATEPAAPRPAPSPRRPRRDAAERPPPPWGSFPLSELVTLIALVLLVGGFIVPPPRGPVMIGTGLALGSLAGLELSIREHFSGFRSHTVLLAGAVGVAVIATLFVLARDALPALGILAAGLAAFALAAWGLASVFRRRSGGAVFKVR